MGVNSTSLAISLTDDGIHLENSVLWLDAIRKGQLSFLSHARPISRIAVPKVLATEETFKLIGPKKTLPNMLVCQYNQPFAIGQLRIELLPAGSALGAASLYVETNNSRLLYAPHLQVHRIPTVRKMQLRKAEVLILGADYAEATPNRARQRDQMVSTVLEMIKADRYPLIFCEKLVVAPELCRVLGEAGVPVAVHRALTKTLKVYETHGSEVGSYTVYDPRRPKNRAVLMPRSLAKNFSCSNRPAIVIDDTPGQSDLLLSNCAEVHHYCLSPSASEKELKEVITAVQPKQVLFFGPYAKRYVESLRSTAPYVAELFQNNQPTLF